jgi:hypothetical protein
MLTFEGRWLKVLLGLCNKFLKLVSEKYKNKKETKYCIYDGNRLLS